MSTGSDAVAPPRRATARQWAGLALMLLPMLVLASDLTVLFFAMPELSADLRPSTSQGLWIVHVYGFLIAGFLVTMGRLGDRVGPRRLLIAGSAVFAALSVVAAFATSAEMLIVTRALLGIAGASLMPSLLSLLRTMFVDEQQRRVAIAIMISAFSVGGAIGPLLGGALLEAFWWGSVFLVNVPPMVVLVALGCVLLPERRPLATSRLDPVSVALSVAGMLAVAYGLQELAAGQETGAGTGWHNWAYVAGGAVSFAVFLRRQRRLPEPLLDLALLTNRRIGTSLATLMLVGIGLVGVFYLLTQYLQLALGLGPLRAGLWTLPYIVLNIAGSMLAPLFTRRARPVVVVLIGLCLGVFGLALTIPAASPGMPTYLLIGSLSIAGLGQGLAVALVSDLIIGAAPEEQTGSAAAAQEVGGELGTAVGIAAGGAIGVVAYRAALPDAVPAEVPEGAARAAETSPHEGVAVADQLPQHGPALLDGVQQAVASGLQVYAGVGAALVATGAVLVGVFLVRGGRAEQDASAARSAQAAQGGPVRGAASDDGAPLAAEAAEAGSPPPP